ncbi:MAG: DNA cytosine methyltransferase [Magnetococcales bacterium]|nr:DNA cytosine methyltransferase [Magnetococcales bacterium]
MNVENATLNPFKAVDLFCGSGGVTLGLKQAGFTVVSAVDNDPLACQTYHANHPTVQLFNEDIRTLDPERLLPHVDGVLDLLVICAPCQPFSSQNRKRSDLDDRTALLLATTPFVEKLRPRGIFVENVPGLKNTPILPSFLSALSRMGYTFTDPVEVDAYDLGVPQRRKRTIFCAIRSEVGRCPDFRVLPRHERSNVRQVIGNLPPPSSHAEPGVDPLHLHRSHQAITLTRLRHIPKNGGSRSALPPELQLKCHKKVSPHAFSDTYGRMAWDEPAPTMTTGCTDLTRGRFAHPEEDRSITPREAARLQTFPDDYQFIGSMGQIARQIGNAVPPRMMRVLAESLLDTLSAQDGPRLPTCD